jgi:hypothetical protein
MRRTPSILAAIKALVFLVFFRERGLAQDWVLQQSRNTQFQSAASLNDSKLPLEWSQTPRRETPFGPHQLLIDKRRFDAPLGAKSFVSRTAS